MLSDRKRGSGILTRDRTSGKAVVVSTAGRPELPKACASISSSSEFESVCTRDAGRSVAVAFRLPCSPAGCEVLVSLFRDPVARLVALFAAANALVFIAETGLE